MRERSCCGATLVAVVALLTAACSAAVPVYGEEELVETSRDERPDWLEVERCPERKVCAVGRRTRAKALEHARTDAHQAAVKEYAYRLETKARAKYGAGRSDDSTPELGEDSEGVDTRSELYAAASRLTIQDVTVEDFWWRRVRSLGEDQRYRYYYDYDILVSIPEATWKKKVRDLLAREKRKAQAAGKAELEKRLEEFSKDVLEDETAGE